MDDAEQAEQNFVQQFKQKEIPDDIPDVRIESDEPIWICKLMGDVRLVASSGETRRLIEPGGIKLNGGEIYNVHMGVEPAGWNILQAGKGRFFCIYFRLKTAS